MKTNELPVVSCDVGLKVAIDTMTHGKLGAVLLTDKNGKLVAILSDGDLRRALQRDDFDINDKALNYATKEPKIIDDDEMLASTALKIIEKYKIQLLVIVNDKKFQLELYTFMI